jgi:hypothetical protein
MVIVETGLPPGAEVDRATLEKLLASHRISKYSITPERVTFYAWPHQATTRFSFSVRPRLAMTAKTAPSLIYDYYNPDQWQAAAPLQLTVRSAP